MWTFIVVVINITMHAKVFVIVGQVCDIIVDALFATPPMLKNAHAQKMPLRLRRRSKSRILKIAFATPSMEPIDGVAKAIFSRNFVTCIVVGRGRRWHHATSSRQLTSVHWRRWCGIIDDESIDDDAPTESTVMQKTSASCWRRNWKIVDQWFMMGAVQRESDHPEHVCAFVDVHLWSNQHIYKFWRVQVANISMITEGECIVFEV